MKKIELKNGDIIKDEFLNCYGLVSEGFVFYFTHDNIGLSLDKEMPKFVKTIFIPNICNKPSKGLHRFNEFKRLCTNFYDIDGYLYLQVPLNCTSDRITLISSLIEEPVVEKPKIQTLFDYEEDL